jgi:hypothetical protein
MNNGDKPAAPVPLEAWNGLTKREAFAKAAMQGLLANSQLAKDITDLALATSARNFADATLAALEAEK